MQVTLKTIPQDTVVEETDPEETQTDQTGTEEVTGGGSEQGRTGLTATDGGAPFPHIHRSRTTGTLH